MNRYTLMMSSATACFLILSFLNCATEDLVNPADGPVDGDNVITETHGAITLKKSNADRDSTPDVSAADISSVTTGNTLFAIAMYKKLKNDTGNVFFSPFSISTALAMTWAGAHGETELDMASVLHFPFSQEKQHAAFNALDLALTRHAEASGFDLHIVNQVWGEITYTFQPDYLKLLSVNYGAAMHLLDFVGNPEPSRLVINDWVSEKTNEWISDLIPQGIIDNSTRLVLTNAIYFKAQWADTFLSSDTRDNFFFRSTGDPVTTKFMSRQGTYNYDSTADYQAIELPYKGNETSMLIVLPAPGKMEQVEEGISADFLTTLYASMLSANVSLQMPKFTFTTESMSLSDILKSLGMAIAFSGQADFSGINGFGNLCIGDVIHKSFVAIDEKGTEAAGATAVIIIPTAIRPPQTRKFIADRPFFFLIRDIQTSTVLFMGKLTDPTKE